MTFIEDDVFSGKNDVSFLEKDEQRFDYKSIFDSISDGLIIINQDGRIETLNTFVVSLFGYTQEELTGSRITLLIPGLLKKQPISYPTKVEILGYKKNKSPVPLKISIHEIKKNDEDYYSVLIRDISDQKFSEEQLQIATAAFETNEAIFVTDKTGKIIKTNSAFTKISGYTLDEIKRKTPRILKTGIQGKTFYKKLWGQLVNTGLWEGEIRNKKKNGEIYQQIARITAVKNSEGVTTHYVSIFSDTTEITHQKKYLAKKTAEENALNSLLHLSLESSDMKDFLQKSLNKILSSVPWLKRSQKGAIFLVNFGEEDVLEMVAQYKMSAKIKKLCNKVDFGSCLCGLAAQKGELQYAFSADDRHTVTFKGMKEHGHYNIPVFMEDEVVGIIVFYLPPDHKKDENEEPFLKQIADVLSLGISEDMPRRT